MNDKAYTYFQTGLEKCQEQFEEAGLLLSDQSNLSDLEKVIASLPDDAAERSKKKTTEVSDKSRLGRIV